MCEVAVIADCHLGGPGGPAEGLVTQLEELPQRGCRQLVLLGDIFQIWVGNRRLETPDVHRLLPALKRLSEQGVRVDYIEGNRDFFIADSPYAQVFTTIGTELTFEVNGVRYLAVHGDGLNDRDRQYLFWRWLSKSPPVRGAVRWLPGLVARPMSSMERQLARTNFKHRVRIPEEAIITCGERRLREGYDVMLLGHFHRPRTWQVAGGEIRLLDAWFNSQHIEWLPATGR